MGSACEELDFQFRQGLGGEDDHLADQVHVPAMVQQCARLRPVDSHSGSFVGFLCYLTLPLAF